MDYKGMNILKKYTFILLVIVLGFSSCRSHSSVSKSIDKINDTKDAKAKEVQVAYDKAIKRHQDIQTKKTRKRMKEDKKKASKWSKKHIGSIPNCPVGK
jgi:hypothetical protein